MKKFILLVLCLLLAFYVGWPMWSAYRIHSALESNDSQTLESKVDFPSVRASLKPVVAVEVERALEKAAGRGGGVGQLLGGALKQQLAPQLVDTILNGFVNSKQVAEIYQRRGDIREIVNERLGKRGGQSPGEPPAKDTGPAAAGTGDGGSEKVATSASPREKFSFSNIKRFAFTGPLAFEVGVAKDKSAAVPDMTAQLGFKNFDWKLVGLIPKGR